MRKITYYPASISIDELNTEDLIKYQNRLYPGEYSSVGFLGLQDKLIDIYNLDKEYLKSVNITPSQIADRLEYILLQHEHKITSKFQLKTIVATKGHQTCPFHELDDKRNKSPPGCNDYELINTDTGENFTFPILIIHLIRAHGFFEGPNSPYRVHPETLVRVLEIEPHKDYSINYDLELEWDRCYASTFAPKSKFNKIKPLAIKTIETKIYNAALVPVDITFLRDYDYTDMNLLESLTHYITEEETESAKDEGVIKYHYLTTGSKNIDVKAIIEKRMDKIKIMIESYLKGELQAGLYLYLLINEVTDSISVPEFLFSCDDRLSSMEFVYKLTNKKVYKFD